MSTLAASLRVGPWESVLADVADVGAIVTDPPYSARTHVKQDKGQHGKAWPRSDGKLDPRCERRQLSYDAWGEREIDAFVDSWAPRCDGWFVCLSDSDLCHPWRAAFERNGLVGFQPIPIVIPGMTVRFGGDGPSSWAIYANVARPKSLHRWGTLPGAYTGNQGEREHVGGKPLWAMRALIRDYSNPGDLICDPCAGAATTLIAAIAESRRAIGAEVDPETHRKGIERLGRGVTIDLFGGDNGR